MDMENCFQASMREIEHEMSQRKGPPMVFSEGTFFIPAKHIFSKRENIRVRVHHPMWARKPLKQPHHHDFFEMVYVKRGGFETIIDGRSLTQKNDILIILRPGAYHSVWTNDEQDQIFNIMIREDAVRQSLLPVMSAQNPLYAFFFKTVYDMPEKLNYLILHANDRIESQVQSVIAEYFNKEKDYEQAMFAHLVMLFTECARNRENDNSFEISESLKDEILEYIRSNFLTVTQKTVAEHFYYSERQMSRILKKYTTKSFPGIVNEYKIDEILKLHETMEGVAIHTLAEKMGFSDINYFYRVFQRVKGMSYSEYQKSQ